MREIKLISMFDKLDLYLNGWLLKMVIPYLVPWRHPWQRVRELLCSRWCNPYGWKQGMLRYKSSWMKVQRIRWCAERDRLCSCELSNDLHYHRMILWKWTPYVSSTKSKRMQMACKLSCRSWACTTWRAPTLARAYWCESTAATGLHILL